MKLVENARRKLTLLSGASVSAGAAIETAFAEGSDAGKIVGRIIGLMTSIFMYVGIVLLVWGVAQFILALKNDDADSKTKAIWLVVVSVALIAIRPILGTILEGQLGNVEINNEVGL